MTNAKKMVLLSTAQFWVLVLLELTAGIIIGWSMRGIWQ